MQGLWSGWHYADTRPPAHHVGERRYAPHRCRCGNTDPVDSLWHRAGVERGFDMAGAIRGPMGSCRRTRCASYGIGAFGTRRIHESRHDSDAPRLSSEERRALWIECDDDRIFRESPWTKWRAVPGGIDRDRRPTEPESALCHE